MSQSALNAMNRTLSESPVTLDISRSTFPRSSRMLTTFNTGDLCPIFIDPVMAGDTYSVNISEVIRASSALKHPVMDDCVADVYFFFVPHRLTWKHTAEFYGENKTSYWEQTGTFTVPQVTFPSTGWKKGDVAEHFGLPVGGVHNGRSVDARPFRAYALIYNEWFRNENVQSPAAFSDGDQLTNGKSGGDPFTSAVCGGAMLKANKRFDYFTACLPAPQKGTAAGLSNLWKVITQDQTFDTSLLPSMTVDLDVTEKPVHAGFSVNGAYTGSRFGAMESTAQDVPITDVHFNNLYATGQIGVNDLRFAFQLQKALEKDAMGGTRFREMLKAHFGTTIPDATVQIPEYLGGHHFRILNHQVAATAATTNAKVGEPAAYSLTGNNGHVFTKSFCEPGFVIGVCTIRVANRTYQQGIEKFWTRKDRWDEYWPVFANIGNQPVYASELFLGNENVPTNTVFGYSEAWADYRFKPSHVTGQFRSGVTGTLDSWHYADYFNPNGSAPVLGAEFMTEPVEPVDRTRTVTSTDADQWIADFYFDVKATRPMPVYSIPGLIDHH